MSPLTCVLVLAATLVGGGAGLAAAALVAFITEASRLRYHAYSAALVLPLVPLLLGVPIAGAPGVTHVSLTGMASASVLRWTVSAPSQGLLSALAQAAPGLLAVYSAGAAACLLRLGHRLAALRKIVGGARPVDAEELGGRQSSLPVRVTDGLRSALLVGVRRPVALLPAGALAQMSASQLGWVLAHEEAHARRRDNLRLLAEEALRAVLWFNPFVAWAAAKAAEAREQLCDQAVLCSADAEKRRAYAETLLLAFRLGAQSQIASSLITPGRRKLVMRFNMILNPIRPTPTRAAASVGLVTAAGLLACLTGAAAWAQAPETFRIPVDHPMDIKADRTMTAGCEHVFSGNVTVQSGNHTIKADLLRAVAAIAPKGCGRLLTLEAFGNVVSDNQGQVEHGQVARIDTGTGTIVVN